MKTAGVTQQQVAETLGITKGRVSQWLTSGRIPAERCPAFSRLTGIPLRDLRPDIYPGEPSVDASP